MSHKPIKRLKPTRYLALEYRKYLEPIINEITVNQFANIKQFRSAKTGNIAEYDELLTLIEQKLLFAYIMLLNNIDLGEILVSYCDYFNLIIAKCRLKTFDTPAQTFRHLLCSLVVSELYNHLYTSIRKQEVDKETLEQTLCTFRIAFMLILKSNDEKLPIEYDCFYLPTVLL
jgi:hypothetical protein